MERVSISRTLWLFKIAWIIIAVLNICATIYCIHTGEFKNSFERCYFPFMCLLALVGLYRALMMCDKVDFDNRYIYFKRFGKEQYIPLSNIKSVTAKGVSHNWICWLKYHDQMGKLRRIGWACDKKEKYPYPKLSMLESHVKQVNPNFVIPGIHKKPWYLFYRG